MSSLSKRARALVDAPPLPPYVAEHFTRNEHPWHPVTNSRGYIPLCIAENRHGAAELLDTLHSYTDDLTPACLGYDAMTGSVEFRGALAGFLGRHVWGRHFAPEQLAVLSGAGSVLELLFYAIGDPGDAVLVPTPSYAGFWPDLETRDALSILPVPTAAADGFALSIADLDAALERSERPVRALLFTSPDNPLGRVYERETLLHVLAWAESRELHVVFDEVYALSVFGERPFTSAASLRAELGPRIHLVWAFSKDFGASGLRCGVLATENEELLLAVNQLAYWSACSGHTQALLARFVADEAVVSGYVARMRDGLRRAYGDLQRMLEPAGVAYVPAEAGFFVLCDLRRWLDAPTWDAEHRLWSRLVAEANVNLTPGQACRIAEPGFFRLCYAAVERSALEVGVDRLIRCLG